MAVLNKMVTSPNRTILGFGSHVALDRCSRRGSRSLFPTRLSTAVPDAVLPPPSLESYLLHPCSRGCWSLRTPYPRQLLLGSGFLLHSTSCVLTVVSIVRKAQLVITLTQISGSVALVRPVLRDTCISLYIVPEIRC